MKGRVRIIWRYMDGTMEPKQNDVDNHFDPATIPADLWEQYQQIDKQRSFLLDTIERVQKPEKG